MSDDEKRPEEHQAKLVLEIDNKLTFLPIINQCDLLHTMVEGVLSGNPPFIMLVNGNKL